MTKPILIIKAGETLPHLYRQRGDFEDWVMAPLAKARLDFTMLAPYKEALPSTPTDFAGVIITGSHAMVTDRETWSEQTAAWIPRVIDAGVPLLGICYGHQLLAYALGGQVAANPMGNEYGTVDVRLTDEARKDSLFTGLPEVFKVQVTHSESVVKLPAGAVRLAFNDMDANQAFSFGNSAWGFQFHPEYDADVTTTYLGTYKEMLGEQGQDVETLLSQVTETPQGRTLLRRFATLINR